MTFRVGQKVVCVDVSGWPASGGRYTYPQRGKVYTVREILCDADGDRNIRVAEIKNPMGICIATGDFAEAFFLAHRFRPIVSRKTDISALKALLVPGAKIRETA